MKRGLFCVHGFMENGKLSYEHFEKYLLKLRIKNYFLTDLQGHGEEEDIRTFNYQKCIDKVTKEYQDYLKEHDEVYLIGFSMGGVIASYLASEYGCKKLVLVSPAFKYGHSSQVLKDIINVVHLTKEDSEFPSLAELLKRDSSDRKSTIQEFVNAEYGSKGSSYENFLYKLGRAHPTTFLNFARLVAKLRKKINIHDIPVRIYHAEFDELVPIQSSLYIFNKIKSVDKRLILLSGVHHRILASNVRDDVFKEILAFFYEDLKKKLIA